MKGFSHLPRGDFDPAAARRRWDRAARWLRLLLLFACAEVSVHWALLLLARAQAVPAGALQSSADAIDAAAAEGARLFAQGPRPMQRAPRRFHLVGVIGGGRRAGAALISIDGKPAQAFAVGSWIAPGVRLSSTGFGQVEIEQHGEGLRLDTGSQSAGARPGVEPQQPSPR